MSPPLADKFSPYLFTTDKNCQVQSQISQPSGLKSSILKMRSRSTLSILILQIILWQAFSIIATLKTNTPNLAKTLSLSLVSLS